MSARTWTRVPDGGWINNEPAYISGPYIIARDYDDEDGTTHKTMWFLHHEDDGFLVATETLRDAKAHVPD